MTLLKSQSLCLLYDLKMKIRKIRKISSNIRVIEQKKDKEIISKKENDEQKVKPNLLENIALEEESQEKGFKGKKIEDSSSLFLEELNARGGFLEGINFQRNFSENVTRENSVGRQSVYQVLEEKADRNVYLTSAGGEKERAYKVEEKMRIVERRTDKGLSFPMTPVFRDASSERENILFQNLPSEQQKDSSKNEKKYHTEHREEVKIKRRMPWE